jgi:hypothetical protein
MRLSRLKVGTSAIPETNGVPCITTGPSLVRKRPWHAGRDQTFLMAPARHSVSARWGKPPTLGRLATARLCAASRFSTALLILVPFLDLCPFPLVRGHPCFNLQKLFRDEANPSAHQQREKAVLCALQIECGRTIHSWPKKARCRVHSSRMRVNARKENSHS